MILRSITRPNRRSSTGTVGEPRPRSGRSTRVAHARAQFIELSVVNPRRTSRWCVNESPWPNFINVQDWHFEDDPLPDPILRGIHEYVFQQSLVGRTWMMEGGLHRILAAGVGWTTTH